MLKYVIEYSYQIKVCDIGKMPSRLSIFESLLIQLKPSNQLEVNEKGVSVDSKYLILSVRFLFQMRVYIAQFIPGLNLIHFDPSDLKIDFLIFLGTKALLMKKSYTTFQVHLIAIYDKQIRKIVFFFYLLSKNLDFACFIVTFILKH